MRGGRLREVVAHGGSTAAYEINARGWNKRLGLEGAGGAGGGGDCFLKIIIAKWGGGGGWGYNFHM